MIRSVIVVNYLTADFPLPYHGHPPESYLRILYFFADIAHDQRIKYIGNESYFSS